MYADKGICVILKTEKSDIFAHVTLRILNSGGGGTKFRIQYYK